MRIGRAVLPAIVALSLAASALMGSAAGAVAATHSPGTSHTLAFASDGGVYYRG
jgi:hypothetical protein